MWNEQAHHRTTHLLLMALVLIVAGCSEDIDPNEPTGFIQVKGSDTIVNASQEISEEFMKDYPHVFVAITGGLNMWVRG